jgi:hypothetical protein
MYKGAARSLNKAGKGKGRSGSKPSNGMTRLRTALLKAPATPAPAKKKKPLIDPTSIAGLPEVLKALPANATPVLVRLIEIAEQDATVDYARLVDSFGAQYEPAIRAAVSLLWEKGWLAYDGARITQIRIDLLKGVVKKRTLF